MGDEGAGGRRGGTVPLQAVIRPQSGAAPEGEEGGFASTVSHPEVASAHPVGVDVTRPSQLAMIVCDACNVATPEAKYCSECGAPLVVKRFCSECGARLQPKARFCDTCGERVATR